MSEAGYTVTVLTVAHTERFEATDRGLLRDASFQKVTIDFLAPGVGNQVSSFWRRGRTWLARRGARYGYESAEAFGPFHAMLEKARALPSDLTVAHTELGLCVAHALAKEGRRVAADFEDWHSHDLLPAAQSSRPRTLLQRVELQLLRHARYCSTTSHALAAALQAAAGGPLPAVITNSFPLTTARTMRDNAGPPTLIWFSQTIGPGRGLESFLDAWSLTRSPSRVHLVGDVQPQYQASLLQCVPAPRRADLAFLPLVEPWELPAVLGQHDVGLALEQKTPESRNLTITNKILQYQNAGLAIVASNTSGQQEVMSRAPECGIVVDLGNNSELTAQLDSLLEDRVKLRSMGAAARRAAESIYCWEHEASRLLHAVETALRA